MYEPMSASTNPSGRHAERASAQALACSASQPNASRERPGTANISPRWAMAEWIPWKVFVSNTAPGLRVGLVDGTDLLRVGQVPEFVLSCGPMPARCSSVPIAPSISSTRPDCKASRKGAAGITCTLRSLVRVLPWGDQATV